MLPWVFAAAGGLSLVGDERGLLILVMLGLLVMVASLLRSTGSKLRGLGSCDTQV